MMGRKPACCAPSLKKCTTSGHKTLRSIAKHEKKTQEKKLIEGKNYTHNRIIDQSIFSGNRINHNPLVPKTFVAPANHRRPATLSDIVASFAASYFNPDKHQKLYKHLDQAGNCIRQMRSEFREMVSIGCSVITHYYDVLTGELGFKNQDGANIRYSYEQIAGKIGVSVIRIKRFFRFLKDRGFIHIIEDKKKDDRGVWSSNIAKKIIKPSFFIETLGISAWKKIVKYKQWLTKKAKPVTTKQKENASALKEMISQIFKAPVKKPTERYQIHPDKEKKFIEQALERFKEDPSKSPSEHLKEIKTKLA